MVKVKERTKKYEISVKEREDGYVSRITFKLGNQRNPRTEGFGTTTDLSVLNLVYKLEDELEDSYSKGLIVNRIDNCVSRKLLKSINDLEVTMPEIMEGVSSIISKINTINAQLTNTITLQNGIAPYNTSNLVINTPIVSNISNSVPKTSENILLEAFAKEWFKYKLSLCKATKDNPRPLSQNTVDGYHRTLFKQILPYMKKNKIVYLQQINTDIIENLLKEQNGYDEKRIMYIVFSMLFKYAVKKKNGIENLMLKIDKPKEPPKKNKKKKTYVTTNNEEVWLDKLEEENTDISLIFLTMLTEGCRPEEATSVRWSYIDFENDTIRLDDAYKSFAVYDDDCNVIGREQRLDKLKTDESYRTLPLHPRLKKALLKHREEQREKFRNSIKLRKRKRYWSEEEFCFQSKYYRPYLTSSLDKPMRAFCKKYNLSKVVPYSLRRLMGDK